MSLEDKFYPLLSIYKKLPYIIKYFIGKVYRLLPSSIKYGSFYNVYLLRIKNFTENTQKELLNEQIVNAVSNVPFYKEYVNKELSSFPIINKEIIKKNFELFQNLNLNSKLIANTGGSSGTPFTFFLEKNISRPKEKAHFDWYWSQFGYSDNDRILMIRGESLKNNNLYEYESIDNKLSISCYLINDDNINSVIKRINQFRPKFIHAYPSALKNLVSIINNNCLNLDIKVSAIFLGSESLLSSDKILFKKFFNAKISHWYGHSEKLVHAGNCPYSEMLHIYPFYGLVQLFDENNIEITKPNIKGRIISTGFDNKIMPLIKYDTGDEAEYSASEICKCGFKGKSFLKINGRKQDYIFLENKSKVSLTAFIFGQHFKEFSKILEIQLEQFNYGELEIRIKIIENFSVNEINLFKTQLESSVNFQIIINITIVENIPKTIRGKHIFLIQHIISK